MELPTLYPIIFVRKKNKLNWKPMPYLLSKQCVINQNLRCFSHFLKFLERLQMLLEIIENCKKKNLAEQTSTQHNTPHEQEVQARGVVVPRSSPAATLCASSPSAVIQGKWGGGVGEGTSQLQVKKTATAYLLPSLFLHNCP